MSNLCPEQILHSGTFSLASSPSYCTQTLVLISLDFVMGLQPSKRNTVVMTVVDRFSKMVQFVPLAKFTLCKQTAEVMIISVFRIHCLLSDVISDRGLQFVALFWKVFWSLLGASVSLSSGSNGHRTHKPRVRDVFTLSMLARACLLIKVCGLVRICLQHFPQVLHSFFS